MQARRSDGRRAAPPRPTLLVGDLAACHAAFGRLQQRMLALSLEQQATVDEGCEAAATVDAWRDLVPLCRALRETLTSLRELSHFTREVYECAADVCARAGDFPEALKALQQLVHLIYPALASQEAALADAEEHGAAGQPAAAAVAAPAPAGPPGLSLHGRVAAGSNGSWSAGPAAAAAALQRPQPAAAVAGWVEDGDAEDEAWADAAAGAAALCDASLLAALQRRAFRRWPEVAAALSLYFACVQQGPGSDRLDTLATLRRLPHLLLAMPEVQTALRLRRALAAGDFVALFRQRPTAPRLVQLVVDAAVVQARERALGVIAAAYRNIATAAVCRMLALDSRQLLACLKVLADRGHLAAQRALDGLQQADAPAAADLVFKG